MSEINLNSTQNKLLSTLKTSSEAWKAYSTGNRMKGEEGVEMYLSYYIMCVVLILCTTPVLYTCMKNNAKWIASGKVISSEY